MSQQDLETLAHVLLCSQLHDCDVYKKKKKRAKSIRWLIQNAGADQESGPLQIFTHVTRLCTVLSVKHNSGLKCCSADPDPQVFWAGPAVSPQNQR